MAEKVGFSNPIKLEWLNDVAVYASRNLSREEAGVELNNTISQFITSPDNIRKIRVMLLNIWYRTTPSMLSEAKAVYNCVSSDEKIGIHYALMADYYQVFFDVADVFGHLLVYRDEVSATQVKAKIFEKWGQRSTLDTSLSKILKTFRDITAVSSPKRQSEYVCVKHKINDIHVLGLLLQALLKNSNQNYIGWDEFLSNPFMFPFEVCDLDESHIAALPFIELSRIDGRTVMSIKGYESTI